ncbi:MAG: hypothetical protein WC894_04830 [Patescibacteria group bacterium]
MMELGLMNGKNNKINGNIKNKLSPEQSKELLRVLKARFEKN